MEAKRHVLGAAIGNCVHVAGVFHFLQLAESEGYECSFMGPAVSIDRLVEKILEVRPDMVGVSYRLTPENARPLLDELKERAGHLDYTPTWVFGGTRPVSDVAKQCGIFSYVSDGWGDGREVLSFLRGAVGGGDERGHEATLIDRIAGASPFPLLRHHFGLPSLEKTISGVSAIAESKVLDVISIGPDQNAQQFFFDQGKMNTDLNGAGGVPVRSREDFRRIKAAAQRGNYPLLRCYSGTEDVFSQAEMLLDTIDNAWAAIPLFWYNELDGRGTRPIEVSIPEAQRLVSWHAKRGIPVEINDPHQWGLRDAHDVMTVVSAYIAAYNAKRFGVRHYVSQYMFNTPVGTSFSKDLARVMAMVEIVENLSDDTFSVYRETRAGLPLLSADPNIAKGQLATSTFIQMAVRPHIVHVVGFCEADHAANPEEVIESCRIVNGVIRHTIDDSFSIETDAKVVTRKNELLSEARVWLEFIANRYAHDPDPLVNPEILSDIVKKGYLDAVHITHGGKFRGNLHTTFADGACVAYDISTGEVLDEATRLAGLGE